MSTIRPRGSVHHPITTLALAVTLTCAACASGGGAATAGTSVAGASVAGTSVAGTSVAGTRVAGGATEGVRRSTVSRLESADFRRPQFQTMYDAIHTLRPDWLQARGSAVGAYSTSPVIGVFIEGQSHGYTLDRLREIVPADVKTARRILASESMGTYGTQWVWGGIVLTLAR